MNITIRKARESDRKQYNWQLHGGVERFRPTIVTVDGIIYVALEGTKVVYQNGSAAVPDLVRMVLRSHRIMGVLYDDKRDRKRQADIEAARDLWDWIENRTANGAPAK